MVEAYGKSLERADFVRDHTEGWRTKTFNDKEGGRLTRIFVNGSWGEKNVTALVVAVRGLVANVSR